MPPVQHVTDAKEAADLATLLNSARRIRPVVVITIPSGRGTPLIDAETVQEDVGDLADVYLITSGRQGWIFSREMPEATQVYGGAGRVYPVGLDWVAHPKLAPLHFAYDTNEGQRATQELVSATLRMAQSAGLLDPRQKTELVSVTARVVGIPIPERAVVEVDGEFAFVAMALTLPGVPLDRVLAEGMHVSGRLDRVSHRLDISGSLRTPEDALQDYAIGDVVPAEVEDVAADHARLLLYPGFAVTVPRAEITPIERDDVRNLMTHGEVLLARVTSAGPEWALSLLHIDDDANPRPAATVLAGGTPWLLPPPPEAEPADEAEETAVDIHPIPTPLMLAHRQATHQDPRTPSAPPTSTTPLAPTPALLARLHQPKPAASPPPASPPAASLPPEGSPEPPSAPTPLSIPPRAPASVTELRAAADVPVEALRSALERVRGEAANLRDELSSSRTELEDLRRQHTAQFGRIARLEEQLKDARKRLRKSKPARTAEHSATPEFADSELAFRYAVRTAWALRTPVGEQLARPLPDYDIGPKFLDSVAQLTGVSVDKIADVVFEVVTGRAREVAGRDLHQLRESAAGNAPTVRRTSDDAVCWRAALQIGTPQARRLHYWVLPGGRIELSRVALHDEFEP